MNPTGAPITQSQFDQMQAQSAFRHTPTPDAQGKQFGERFLGRRAGGEGQDSAPIADIVTGSAEGADKVALTQPHTIDDRVLTVYNAEKPKVRKEFSDILTRNRGDFSLSDLFEVGKQLARTHPDHEQFIGDMLQKHIGKDQNLKAELTEFRQTGGTASTGNATFQQLPPDQQARFGDAIEAAQAEAERLAALPEDDPRKKLAAGSVDPEFLETLGFIKDEKAGFFQKVTFGGELAPLTPRDIIDAANSTYGLGGAAPEPITPPPIPDTLTQDAAPVAPLITELPGIEGVMSGPRGTIVRIQGGAEITSETGPDHIATLMERGNPNDIDLATNLSRALGIPLPEAPAPAAEPPAAAAPTIPAPAPQAATAPEPLAPGLQPAILPAGTLAGIRDATLKQGVKKFIKALKAMKDAPVLKDEDGNEITAADINKLIQEAKKKEGSQ